MSSRSTTARLGWFQDRSVRTKILAAVTTAALVAVLVGVTGLQALARSAAGAAAIFNENLLGVKAAGELKSAIDLMGISSRSAVITVDPAAKQEEIAALDTAEAAFEEAVVAYSEGGLDRNRQDIVDDLQTSVQDYLVLQREVMAPLALAGDDAGWSEANEAQVRPFTTAISASVAELGTIEADEAASALEDVHQATADQVRQALVILVLGVLLATGLGWVVASSIARRTQRLRAGLARLEQGDLTSSVDESAHDEIGQMGASLDAAMARLREVMTAVVGSADAVAASSEELSASSQQIATGAEETSVQAGVVSDAAEEVSRNVRTVAAGSEQMGASIREIAHSANEAARVAQQAVEVVTTTNETVSKLGTSSAEIGSVIKVITSVVGQTNLLALNATIEAARAGEAGKGFAVVANEVKELAQETARATEDIARRVQAIQADTGGAVSAIGEISSIIAAINDYQLTIASAVEEQTATTNEMARNVAEAATGSGEIAANITGVSSAATSTTQALAQTRTAVDELARMAGELRTTVGHFQH